MVKVRKTGRKLKKFRISKPFTKQQVRTIKKITQSTGETKYFDNTQNYTSIINTTTSISDMFSWYIPQGDGEGERLGNKIFVKSVQVRGLLNMSSTNSLRFLIVRFKDYSSLTTSQIFSDFNIGLRGFYPRSVNEYSYKVIMDKVITLDPDNVNQRYVKWNFPINKTITYPDSSTSIYHTNRYLCFIYTDNTTPSVVSFNYNSRVLYTDP